MGNKNWSRKKETECAQTLVNKGFEADKVIALSGNPNVGKSSVFNALTGMNQHTGNWPGKTVSNAQGAFKTKKNSYILVDIPGTYSLYSHSKEEEVARNYICFGYSDKVVVVCDATCLERNLNLCLQIAETGKDLIVCINLLDEAKRKGIEVDIEALSSELGVDVIGVCARKKKSLDAVGKALDDSFADKRVRSPLKISYRKEIEEAIDALESVLAKSIKGELSLRWIAINLIYGDKSVADEIDKHFSGAIYESVEIQNGIKTAQNILLSYGIDENTYKDEIVSVIYNKAEKIAEKCVAFKKNKYSGLDRSLDRILTGKFSAYPFMILLLLLTFWLTIWGANLPSRLLSNGLFFIEESLTELFSLMNAPSWLHGILVQGVWRVLSWVVSVMLPPMAIFFPLFTLLEDLGYLPRIAYNLDRPFKKCGACGKQALTMCMGFGCNAVGVTGCRIIDSQRERLLAILTNSLVPCNGRFPGIISIITVFFVASSVGGASSALSAALLTAVIVCGVGATFFATKLLSKTLLKGIPSSFTLELPPYRKPQISKILVRSVFDRTLFVLGRAVSVAAPAGMIIWILANIKIGDATLLYACSQLLEPIGRLMGLDGVVLLAFILGFPANEIVLPIVIMAYTSGGSLTEIESLVGLKDILISNGWTTLTAINMIVFSLFHWPCSTTVLTVKKETGSFKWTAASILLPTAMGFACCVIINVFWKIFL